MSRLRSPSGRHAHPRFPPAAAPGALPPRRARAAHAAPAAHAAVRNGLSAAAVTGTALALATPALAGLETVPADDAAVLALSSAGPDAVVDEQPPTGVRMIASITPVGTAEEPPLPEIATADLLKAVGLAEEARRAEEERLAREARARCEVPMRGLGRVKPWVRDAARFLSCLYEQPTLIGVASRGRVSDHPLGLAVDMMVRGERGDRIAECALANQEEFGITYVIWKQRVNYGDGWEYMEDRGGDTANHYDHVHISFDRGGPDGTPLAEACG